MASGNAREVVELMNTKKALLTQTEMDMEIMGDDQQILTVYLKCDEEILVQPGCMVWCDQGIVNEVTAGGLQNFLTRCCCMEESGFRVHWKNKSDSIQRIALTPSFPAKVIPVNLNQHSGELLFKSGAFMAATDPDLSFEIERAGRASGGSFGTGLFGGQGFVLNKVTGDGWVFLGAAGAIFERQLGPGETIIVEPRSVVAWETTCHFSYRAAGGLSMMFCGGEGLTLSTLTGPGYVIIESMPFSSVATMIRQGSGNSSGGKNPLKSFFAFVIAVFFAMFWVYHVSQFESKLLDNHDE